MRKLSKEEENLKNKIENASFRVALGYLLKDENEVFAVVSSYHYLLIIYQTKLIKNKITEHTYYRINKLILNIAKRKIVSIRNI